MDFCSFCAGYVLFHKLAILSSCYIKKNFVLVNFLYSEYREMTIQNLVETGGMVMNTVKFILSDTQI